MDSSSNLSEFSAIKPRHPPPPPCIPRNTVRLVHDLFPHEFWLERYNRDDRQSRTIFQDYSPPWIAPNSKRPSSFPWKFYSRHDTKTLEKYHEWPHFHSQCEQYVRLMAKRLDPKAPWDRRHGEEAMILSSQAYGNVPSMQRFDMFGAPVADYKRPLRRGSLSDHVEQLSIYRVTERPEFAGVPFKC